MSWTPGFSVPYPNEPEVEGGGGSASAVSISDAAGDFIATDVEDALAELQTFDEALPQFEPGTRSIPNTSNPGFLSLDVDLASGISGGDTLTGSTGSAGTLTLASTAHGTRGTINLQDQVLLISEDKTHVGASAYNCVDTPSTRTITMNSATASANSIRFANFAPTVVWDGSPATFSAFLLNNAAVYKNTTGEAKTIPNTITFRDVPTFNADDAAVTFSNHWSFLSSPTVSVTASGTATVSTLRSLQSIATINTGATVTLRQGLEFSDSSGSGTVTLAVGVDIAGLSHATTSIGVRNASRTVNTPATQTITAVSDTIAITATAIRLNNTSGSSKTLTSAPTLANGEQGQIITLFNTSANDVVIQDQGTLASSNLRLGATTRTLSTRDSITLMYNTTIADWIEIGFSNVV